MTSLETLAILARKTMLTPAQAVALPTAITVASGKVGMTETAFLAECLNNTPLAMYVASVCRSVMA